MDLRLKPSPGRRQKTTSTPARRAATWSLLPLGLIGGFAGGRAMRPALVGPLPPAMEADLLDLHIPFGRLTYYRAGPSSGAPLLLIHSINAAGSAYEVKPLFEHYARHRPVYALDLPGFGLSDRLDRIYTPQLMTDAILATVEAIEAVHGAYPIDAIAVSLSSEFLGRAAREHPTKFRSLGLISPTGFDTRMEREGAPGANFGKASVRDVVSFPLWGPTLFAGLVSRPSMRFFLQKTWGAKTIDEGLFEYDYLAAHQPGAEHAPFSFLSGFLFSRDALSVYKELTMPVWMCHGIRGDFVDFTRKREVADKSNWTIEVLRTGALPHFERLDEVIASYDAFGAMVA